MSQNGHANASEVAFLAQLRDKGGLRVHILVPDQTEFNRSYKMCAAPSPEALSPAAWRAATPWRLGACSRAVAPAHPKPVP